MELGYIGIVVAVALFLIGMKVMKWLMWGLGIITIIIAGYFWLF